MFCNYGLTIDCYHVIKLYKTFIPTLRKCPGAIIAPFYDYIIYININDLINIHVLRVTQIYYNGKCQGYHYINGNYLNKLVGLWDVLYLPYCFYKDTLN